MSRGVQRLQYESIRTYPKLTVPVALLLIVENSSNRAQKIPVDFLDKDGVCVGDDANKTKQSVEREVLLTHPPRQSSLPRFARYK